MTTDGLETPLQARMPSSHVCWKFVSPESPHKPNQEAPRAQQLGRREVLVTVRHFRQTTLVRVIATLLIGMCVATTGAVVPVTVVFSTHHTCLCSFNSSYILIGCSYTQLCGSCAHLRSQAWMPSSHVCWKLVSPGSPHKSNQAPPRAQQLNRRTLLATVLPHLGHTALLVVVVVLVAKVVVTTVGGVKPGGSWVRSQEHVVMLNEYEGNVGLWLRR